MTILYEAISLQDLQKLLGNHYNDMIKAVADIRKGVLAIDAELHSDLESLLVEKGSSGEDLWGFNIYPLEDGENFIEYDSLINIRPGQDNRSRNVEDEGKRRLIEEIVRKLIAK